jgi:EF-hand domain pair
MRFRFLFLLLAFSLLPQGVVVSSEEKQSATEREFCRLDKNNDREITFEEFKNCEFYKLEHVRALPYSEAQELRPKGDAKFSDDELKAYLFKKADKNKDNKIDRKEWEEFYNSLVDPRQ